MSGIKSIKNLKPTGNGRYQQGYINPEACRKLFPTISHDKIIYRSSYEKKFIYYLENCPQVRYWGSECVQIVYMSVLDMKTHRYFPDYFIEFVDGTRMLVEVKPLNQTKPPVNENSWGHREYIRNMCKWKAAQEWCQSRGIKFKVLTEKTIENL